MNPSTSIGGYGDEARYILGGDDPKISRAIAQSPADTLSGHPTITRDETAAAYLKASLDLTMEGGTTSGVVYPLAVCELATSFRFRNVRRRIRRRDRGRSHRGRRARSQRAVGGHQQL